MDLVVQPIVKRPERFLLTWKYVPSCLLSNSYQNLPVIAGKTNLNICDYQVG
jgi:hypothetical protein